MKIDWEKRREAVAVFRFGMIADLLHFPRGSKDIAPLLRAKAELVHTIPGSRRYTVAAETIRYWLKLYRRSGFDGLKPVGRGDKGIARRMPRSVADGLCQLKEDNPKLSVQLLIKKARASGIVDAAFPLPQSTVHRLLSRAGLMRRATPTHKDHRRFSFESAGELWMSDVMHGPTVGVGGGVRRKTYLIAFIDDATRVVPYAAFSLQENTTAFLPQLKQAVLRRGIPKRLFVDNGSAYRSHHLQLVCARLGITLIHARPYHPEAKGKQERWFRTVRMQFLPTLTTASTDNLMTLNSRLWSWVEGEYHQAPHRGLSGLTPLDAWAKRATDIKHICNRPDIDDMFLHEGRRRVAKDRTVSLHGTSYEVDAILVGETVTLRFDPSALKSVQVIDAKGKRYDDARPVDIYTNRLVKRAAPQSNVPHGVRMRDFVAGEAK